MNYYIKINVKHKVFKICKNHFAGMIKVQEVFIITNFSLIKSFIRRTTVGIKRAVAKFTLNRNSTRKSDLVKAIRIDREKCGYIFYLLYLFEDISTT